MSRKQEWGLSILLPFLSSSGYCRWLTRRCHDSEHSLAGEEGGLPWWLSKGMAPGRRGLQQHGSKSLTGSREQLGNLLALWHVLDGGVDLFPDGQHQALPF